MLAIHINSAAPFKARYGESFKEKDFKIEIFDLCSTVLSALAWRRLNGEIKLIADKTIYNYYKKLGLLDVWNYIDYSLSENLEGINPIMFWAAGKILALRDTEAPAVMLDTDFIIWETLDFTGAEIIAAHRENLSSDIYPNPLMFGFKKGYSLNERYSLRVLPLNTAFLYIRDEDFKQYYTNMSIEFMKSVEDCGDNLCRMVFAEQRLLAMCADYLKIPVSVLLGKDELFRPQSSFTHLWGAKRILRNDRALREDFSRKCKERILSDFPEYSYIIEKLREAEQ